MFQRQYVKIVPRVAYVNLSAAYEHLMVINWPLANGSDIMFIMFSLPYYCLVTSLRVRCTFPTHSKRKEVAPRLVSILVPENEIVAQ